jgi:hypothetical protein
MNRKIGVQLITFLTILLFVFSALSFTVQSIPPITQETLIVDITGKGDYTSIQEAIVNAAATDIVLIRDGVYNEYNLGVNKKIEITGEDPSTTIINCSGNIAFTLNSPYVDISNLQIINTGEFGISIPPDSTGCTISNCIINTNFKGVAISIRSSYNIVSNCNIIGIDKNKQGIKIRGSNNIVRDCDIQDFANGVLASVSSNNNQILNCNIINNENAVDFRASSNDNVVTGCNIYSNIQSITIWQNSNNNLVYLNNFWKNDIAAIDEGNNSWDNGAQGNYWDRYRGQDSNGDGIGDTPYKISEGNEDRFPFISMILPDIITHPTNVKQTTSKSDNTPSFTWNPSIYRKDIKGYYVKIDNNQEIFVGDTTSWTSSEALSDGVHTFYVWAEGVDNKSSNSSSVTFSIDTTFIDTDGDGWSDEDEQQYGTDPNNPDNYPLDTDGDRTPDTVDTDDDNDGYSDDMESSYRTDTVNLDEYPTDTDNDGVPNDDSSDGKYTGDEDDDDDGLTDTIETTLGSSPISGSDVTTFYISGEPYYLVDLSQNGIYDILYEPTEKTSNGVEKQNDNYLIDINRDGTWDHIYNTLDGSISTYKEELQIPIWVILLLILLPIIIILFYYLRKRPITFRIPRKPERIIKKPLIEKPIRIPVGEKRETVEMIDQTKTLLQHIQKDVEVYMEKLRQIEKQFIETEKLPEEETKVPEKEEETIVKVDVHDVEWKVDKLLESLEDKDKNQKKV